VPKVLPTRALNRALLARQYLLERSTLPLTRVVAGMGGVQSQYAPSAYVGLWSRMQNLQRATLTAALERRQIIQATLMRVTIHMVPARDYWPMTEGVRTERRQWWLRTQRDGLDAAAMQRVADVVRAELGDGSRRHRDLVAAIVAAGHPRVAWQGAGLWVDLVRVPPSGTWERRRADLYGLAEEWLPRPTVTEDEGRRLLVRRYLGAFGPAALKDIANWAGLSAGLLAPVAGGMKLRHFTDDVGRELVDLPGAPLPDPQTPAPVRFLPTWDATLLAHARRTAILSEEHRPLIFHTKNPQSVPTFLVDGVVAGTWRYTEGRVAVEPFTRLDPPIQREVDDEAERLTAFHAEDAA
jgi:hypothetical protein